MLKKHVKKFYRILKRFSVPFVLVVFSISFVFSANAAGFYVFGINSSSSSAVYARYIYSGMFDSYSLYSEGNLPVVFNYGNQFEYDFTNGITPFIPCSVSDTVNGTTLQSGAFKFVDLYNLLDYADLADSNVRSNAIDIFTYNPLADDMSTGTGPSIANNYYWSFSYSFAVNTTVPDGDYRAGAICIPIFSINQSDSLEGVTSNSPRYFCYYDGAVIRTSSDSVTQVLDDDISDTYDVYTIDFLFSSEDVYSALTKYIDTTNLTLFFAGFRVAFDPYSVPDIRSINYVGFQNFVYFNTLTYEEAVARFGQEQLDAINRQTDEISNAIDDMTSDITDTINSPIDNTPITDFDNVEGSAGDSAEQTVDDILDYFDTNGNILADNSPLKNAFLLVGNQFNFVFGTNPYTIWIFTFILVIIFIGVVVRRGIFSAGTGAINRHRNRRNRKE